MTLVDDRRTDVSSSRSTKGMMDSNPAEGEQRSRSKLAASAGRDFDIVILGATGFTGQLVAEYLVGHYGKKGSALSADETPLRFALAGRNQKALLDVRQSLSKHDDGVGILLCDVADPPSIKAVTARAKVLLTTVGPYQKYGTAAVDACVSTKTDYCDITGETPWAGDMIHRYHEQAARDGTVLISFCGFDSIPADLGSLMLHEYARDVVGSPLAKVRSFVEVDAMASGGTIATMIDLAADPRAKKQLRNLFALNPPGTDRAVPVPNEKDVVLPGYDRRAGRYFVPWLMSSVNTRVVRRSAAMLAYGPDFSYNEVMAVKRLPEFLLTAASLLLVGIVLLLVMVVPGFGGLLRRVLPQPGTGPSKEKREKSHFLYRVLGETASGVRLEARVAGGDPGYEETAKMLGESAVALARRGKVAVPGNRTGGYHTTASGLGKVLVERLRRNGMVLQVNEEK